jgi:hypothetical protein
LNFVRNYQNYSHNSTKKRNRVKAQKTSSPENKRDENEQRILEKDSSLWNKISLLKFPIKSDREWNSRN